MSDLLKWKALSGSYSETVRGRTLWNTLLRLELTMKCALIVPIVRLVNFSSYGWWMTTNTVVCVLFLEQLGSTILSQEALLSPRRGKAASFLDFDRGLWPIEKWLRCAWNGICSSQPAEWWLWQDLQDYPLQEETRLKPKTSEYHGPEITHTGLRALFHT